MSNLMPGATLGHIANRFGGDGPLWCDRCHACYDGNACVACARKDYEWLSKDLKELTAEWHRLLKDGPGLHVLELAETVDAQQTVWQMIENIKNDFGGRVPE